MQPGDPPRRPQSWEHLLEKDAHGATRFGIGVAAAVLIHGAIFAVSWPTIAQAPPAEPEQLLYPVPIYDFVPTPPEPEPIIELELPPAPNETTLIVPGDPPEESGEPIEREIPVRPVTTPPIVAIPEDLPPPPPDPPPIIVTADFEVAAPTIVHRVEPRYTEPARHAGIEGVAILELVIGTDGVVESVRVLRGLPLGLTQNAVDAVRQWRFAPSTYKGHPVAVRYVLTVRFTLT